MSVFTGTRNGSDGFFSSFAGRSRRSVPHVREDKSIGEEVEVAP